MRVRFMGYRLHSQQVWLLLADVAAAALAYWLAVRVYPAGESVVVASLDRRFSLQVTAFAAILVAASTALGLYAARQRSGPTGIGVRLIGVVAVSVGMLALANVLTPRDFLSTTQLVVLAASSFAFLAIVRVAIDRVASLDVFRSRVLVYGAGRQATSILSLRRRVDQRGFLLVGFVDCGEPGGVRIPAERIVAEEGSLLALARQLQADEIVVAVDDRRRAFPIHDLLECRLNGIAVIDLVTFLERETGKVRLDVLNPSWFIFADGFRRDPLRTLSTRLFDLGASLAVLLLTWPLMILAVAAIKIEDGWRAPVFYRQTRVGLDGRHFRIVKFRSMRVDAERGGRAQWAQQGDTRVTKVGAFIRKVRIDELPQLFNVIVGDMAFVGPRPERPEFVDTLSERIPYYRERHSVKPGITGWAQLCYPYGASAHDAAEKLQYDLYYVKNHSWLFDLVILVETAETVLFGRGAR
jgi:sugar transferase (PEP-CTERM system associated)